MHITAVCPFCQTSYQVQPSLRGQSIRCPNPVCRKIFTVASDLPVSEDSSSLIRAARMGGPPEGGQRSGTVGEMVPILPAEPIAPEDAPAEPPVATPEPREGSWWQTPPPARQAPGRAANPPAPEAPAKPADAPWWGDAPPPVRHPQARTESPAEPRQRRRPRDKSASPPPAEPAREPAPAPPTQTMPALPDMPDQPRELPPGEWEAPPVRHGADEAEEAPDDTHAPLVGKRRARWLVAILIVVPILVLGGGAWLIYQIVQNSETNRFAEAMDEYKDGKYGSAAGGFHELKERFPNSEHAKKYAFLEDWSGLCSDLSNTENDLEGGLNRLDDFIKKHKDDPLMKEYAHDAGQMLLKLVRAFGERNRNPDSEEPLTAARRIEQVRKTVEGLGPEALTKAEAASIDETLATVRAAVARWSERQQVLQQLSRGPNETPIEAIYRVRRLLQEKDKVEPGFSQDPEVKAAVERLYQAHRDSVVYKPGTEREAGPATERLNDDLESLVFDPLLPTATPGSAPRDDPIVLALVRGVLYALRRSSGEIKWAIRVGIDTTVLPLRVPPSQVSRERILVLSADTQTLTALDDGGNQLWEYHVGQPVLGRPVIIKQRAYLAAYDGWVHEIELSEGNRVGRYHLGQRLSRGGAHEAGTDRIYFPADDSCVYVLDVAQRRCTAILYDGHPSGSLRSEPIVIPPQGENAATPGYLILNQTSGLDAMRLRVFELPLQDRHAAPVNLKPPAEIPGWTWFEPYQDGEKLVMLSDAGTLGLFGIRQAGNSDQPLFPWLRPGGLDLSPFLGVEGGSSRERGRAQVVRVQDNDLWVLAHGRLQQVQLIFTDAAGPRALPGWKEPRMLGSPLHAPQSVSDRTGRSTFFLVTQPLRRQTCMASAVDDEGRILWQRQLGLVCQGEPLALTPPQGGAPLLLALDQGGGLFTLDPLLPANKSWRSLAPALDDNPRMAPFLLPAPDGHSLYEIAAPGEGKSLVVRHIEWIDGERRLRFQEGKVSLAPVAGGAAQVLSGTPAVVGSHLIVPMADGVVRRVPLPVPAEPVRPEPGPDWRSGQASVSAPGHMLALGGDRFLVSDGRRGLAVWEWPAEKNWQPLPEGREQPYELPSLVAAPPVLLPAKADQAPRVIVADATGVLHLLTVTPGGDLKASRTWNLQGRLTAGPFVRVLPDGGVRVGCILDQRRLAWLDPASDQPKPLWTYPAEGETILGQPQLVGDLLVVAHQSGHYLALDPATGEAKGPGYTLRASAAPAATPVPFGPDRLFTPLSDGTALLLPLKRLREVPEKK